MPRLKQIDVHYWHFTHEEKARLEAFKSAHPEVEINLNWRVGEIP
jgi:hypothetical protein